MTTMTAMIRTLLAGAIVLSAACGNAAENDERRRFTFSWQFTESGEMQPRGGTTRGPAVTLREEPTEAWRELQEPGLSDFERDRRAILAMAGGYRTTFDFIETVGFTPDFEPARPYQSWGTEKVYVIEDRGDFISLQHIMVMYFEDEDGEVRGPVVQKHWRQDWRYEDREIHAYAGEGQWRRRRLSEDEADGRWSQAVFQVDDSPRYESAGRWRHEENYSAWTSAETWRPLPRRESSARDDYDVLIGTNRHTITPTGWVQEEENLKTVLEAPRKPAAGTPYLARELGVNRYERTDEFDFSAGDAYWEATGPFWAVVRDVWSDVRARADRFTLADEVDGRALFEPMFEYAQSLEAGEDFDADAAEAFVRRTLDAYVDE